MNSSAIRMSLWLTTIYRSGAELPDTTVRVDGPTREARLAGRMAAYARYSSHFWFRHRPAKCRIVSMAFRAML